MSNTSVSLIIPVFNTQYYLSACFESIEAQNYQDYEVILINDGSTDQSEQMCRDFLAKHPEKTTLITQNNLGQGAARNAGLRIATGNYVCFVDSDDLITPDFLSVMIKATEHDLADVVVTDLIKRFETSGKELIFKNVQLFTTNMSTNLMLSHPGPVAKLIRRSLIEMHSLVFTQGKIYEDLLFNVNLSLCAPKVVYVEVALYIYRVRSMSTMNQGAFSSKLEDIYAVMEMIETQLIDHPAELEYLIIEHILYSASLRFLSVVGGLTYVERNVEWMKQKYPNWTKNPYFLKRNLKFRVVCHLIILRQFGLVKWLSTMRGS
ncbi:MAG: glycosyltransferase [Erysipelotrichaceae bacterium]|nr:glycosyltransferase [Erysipelotrichaceae bacterium]